jgi:hypothetical protein
VTKSFGRRVACQRAALPPRVSVESAEPSNDGKRFLVRERVDDAASRMDIRIVLNWLEELRGKIP